MTSNFNILKKKRTRKLRDRLIRRGLSLEAIGERTGVTRERIRQIIRDSDRYEDYKKSRFGYKNGSKIRDRKIRGLIREIGKSVLDNSVSKLPEGEKWAAEKAIEYRMSLKGFTRNYFLLEDLFSVYFKYSNAKNSGKKLSLNELKKGTRINSNSSICKILQIGGLKPMHRKLNRRTTSKEKKAAIKRSVNSEMNYSDLGYFLNLPRHVVYSNLRLWGEVNKPKEHKRIKQFGVGKEAIFLTYRLASEIYQARDLNFTRKEIRELVNLPTRVVEYALSNEKEISGKIVDTLRLLYPNRKIEEPYLNS